jgi:hypothetical protein
MGTQLRGKSARPNERDNSNSSLRRRSGIVEPNALFSSSKSASYVLARSDFKSPGELHFTLLTSPHLTLCSFTTLRYNLLIDWLWHVINTQGDDSDSILHFVRPLPLTTHLTSRHILSPLTNSHILRSPFISYLLDISRSIDHSHINSAKTQDRLYSQSSITCHTDTAVQSKHFRQRLHNTSGRPSSHEPCMVARGGT